MKCPANQVHQECGSLCKRTCHDLATLSTCQDICIPGCNCRNGTVLNDLGSCVDATDCTCHVDGNTYKPNQVVNKDQCEQWWVAIVTIFLKASFYFHRYFDHCRKFKYHFHNLSGHPLNFADITPVLFISLSVFTDHQLLFWPLDLWKNSLSRFTMMKYIFH